MPAAEHVQRQIAVAVIVAVEEAALLVTMQRIIGGIEIEDDPFRRLLVRLEEEFDEQALDRPGLMADLVIAVERRGRCMLEPVQRALAGQRRAVGAVRLELADQGRQHRIVAQLVVVDEILVAQREAADALHQHGPDAVLDQFRPASVGEASRQAPHQTDRPVRGPEQQRARVRGHLAAVERRHHLASFDGFKSEQIAATLCRHRGSPLPRVNPLAQKSYRRSRAPMHALV